MKAAHAAGQKHHFRQVAQAEIIGVRIIISEKPSAIKPDEHASRGVSIVALWPDFAGLQPRKPARPRKPDRPGPRGNRNRRRFMDKRVSDICEKCLRSWRSYGARGDARGVSAAKSDRAVANGRGSRWRK